MQGPMPMLIQDARIISPSRTIERGWLLIEHDRIAALSPGDPPEICAAEIFRADGLTLLPGFIDIHTHGGMGCDVMQGDSNALQEMARYFASGGVTAYLATTWTDTREKINRALEAVAETMRLPAAGAKLLGAHLEGPFLNPSRAGAQFGGFIRRAGRDEALPWLNLEVIRLLALAPEFEENHWLIEEAVARDVTVSVAHSDATFDQMRCAAEMGISHATHVFNAMSPLHHREPGTVGAVLSLEHISCELICDLVHVHPAAIRILWRCKGPEKVVLVTDSVKVAGLADGRYRFSHQDLELIKGTVRLVEDGTLAGSTLTMNAALKNLMAVTGEPLDKVWQTTSLNPARVINVDDRKGSIVVGKDGDLVLLDDNLDVHLTLAEGRVVYSPAQS